MALDDELNILFDNENLPDDIRKDILNSLTDDAAKEQLIEDTNAYEPEVFTNYVEFHDSIAEYCEAPDNSYGTGTKQSVSNLIAHKTAQEYSADYFDISHVQYDKSADKAALLDEHLAKISAPQSTLMLGEVQTTNDDNSFNSETLSAILQAKEVSKYSSAVMSLSLYNSAGKSQHAVSLVLLPQAHQAMLIDQCGKDPCPEAKEQIKKLLANSSYTVSYEPETIMNNRNDCAVFAAMINEVAAKDGADAIKPYVDDLRSKPDAEKGAEVDAANHKYKEWVADSYWNVYKNNPLFKQYLETRGLDADSLPPEDRMQLLQSFKGSATLTVGETLEDDRAKDPAWKDEVREAVAQANKHLNNSFEEYADSEHPENLYFKDKDNENNVIAFASKENAYVAGEQKSFDELVVTAQKLGKQSITFGQFEKHPEYRAKLYLACIKYGIEMRNAPELEELKEYPEYREIKLRQDFKELNPQLQKAKEDFMGSDACQDLLAKYNEAKKNKEYDKLDGIKEEIAATEEGSALKQLTDRKAQLFKEGMEIGIISKEKVEALTSRRHPEFHFEQKEGESDIEFQARKDKTEAARPTKEQLFGRNLTKTVLKQSLDKTR